MRLITTDEMVQSTLDLFSQYIEPLACSFMYGEVSTSTIMIHRSGDYNNSWFTKIHFKNTIIDPYVLFTKLYDKYKQCMKRLYPDAYKIACSRKSKDYLINREGGLYYWKEFRQE